MGDLVMYKLTTEDFVVRISDGLHVYPKSGSIEGNAYLNWIKAGNQPEPKDLSTDFTYQRQRAAEYPPVTDYVDGVVKGDQNQINKYIADCLAVKAKYPKPEGM